MATLPLQGSWVREGWKILGILSLLIHSAVHVPTDASVTRNDGDQHAPRNSIIRGFRNDEMASHLKADENLISRDTNVGSLSVEETTELPLEGSPSGCSRSGLPQSGMRLSRGTSTLSNLPPRASDNLFHPRRLSFLDDISTRLTQAQTFKRLFTEHMGAIVSNNGVPGQAYGLRFLAWNYDYMMTHRPDLNESYPLFKGSKASLVRGPREQSIAEEYLLWRDLLEACLTVPQLAEWHPTIQRLLANAEIILQTLQIPSPETEPYVAFQRTCADLELLLKHPDSRGSFVSEAKSLSAEIAKSTNFSVAAKGSCLSADRLAAAASAFASVYPTLEREEVERPSVTQRQGSAAEALTDLEAKEATVSMLLHGAEFIRSLASAGSSVINRVFYNQEPSVAKLLFHVFCRTLRHPLASHRFIKQAMTTADNKGLGSWRVFLASLLDPLIVSVQTELGKPSLKSCEAFNLLIAGRSKYTPVFFGVINFLSAVLSSDIAETLARHRSYRFNGAATPKDQTLMDIARDFWLMYFDSTDSLSLLHTAVGLERIPARSRPKIFMSLHDDQVALNPRSLRDRQTSGDSIPMPANMEMLLRVLMSYAQDFVSENRQDLSDSPRISTYRSLGFIASSASQAVYEARPLTPEQKKSLMQRVVQYGRHGTFSQEPPIENLRGRQAYNLVVNGLLRSLPKFKFTDILATLQSHLQWAYTTGQDPRWFDSADCIGVKGVSFVPTH